MADKDSSSRKEPSDLFKVEEATPSIAPVDKIVLPPEEALKRITSLEKQMYQHARDLEFEEAAQVRDQIELLRRDALG